MLNRPTKYLTAMLITLCIGCLVLSANQSFASEQISPGTNSRQAKKQAIQTLPYSQLNADTQSKISSVVNNPSIYRRLPVTAINVDPDMFLFLVRYPEVIVNIWQLMGVTQMTVDRTGPFTMKSNDGAGAISNVELVYGTHNKNIYYAEGTYSGPLLKRKLKGRAVMILNTSYERDANGKPRTVNSLDVFVKVENATASLIAKTLNPIVGPTADHNFVESMKFVQRLNETTEQNGIGVQRMAQRLTSIEETTRNNFAKIAGTVYERSARKPTVRNASVPDQNRSSQSRIPAYPPQSQYTKNRFGILQTGFREIKSVFGK